MLKIEQAKKEYQKLKAKFRRYQKSLESTSDQERRIKIESKMSIVEHQIARALTIHIALQFEQAGRDMVKAARDIDEIPGEHEKLIQAINLTPKHKSLKEEMKKIPLNKEINSLYLDIAIHRAKEVFYDLCTICPGLDDDDDDDDDDDENEEDEPKPDPVSPNSHLISI